MMDKLPKDCPPVAKPPVSCATRWAGQLVSLSWVVHSKKALRAYDRLPATDTALLDDGSTYVDHIMSIEDWEVAEQLVLSWEVNRPLFCIVPIFCIVLNTNIDYIVGCCASSLYYIH